MDGSRMQQVPLTGPRCAPRPAVPGLAPHRPPLLPLHLSREILATFPKSKADMITGWVVCNQWVVFLRSLKKTSGNQIVTTGRVSPECAGF